jgi:hypothetical protein
MVSSVLTGTNEGETIKKERFGNVMEITEPPFHHSRYTVDALKFR